MVQVSRLTERLVTLSNGPTKNLNVRHNTPATIW